MEDLAIEAARLKEDKTALEDELVSREFVLQQEREEAKRLEETVGELRMQVHSLEAQCDLQEKQFNIHLQELTSDYNIKLE